MFLLTWGSQKEGQEGQKDEKKANNWIQRSHGGLKATTSISLFAFSHAEHWYNALLTERWREDSFWMS